jgi:hypothetical protein
MTVPIIKVKIFPKPVIKGKMDVRFPANIQTKNFLTVARANGIYTFDVDYSVLEEITSFDPSQELIAVQGRSGIWNLLSLATLFSITTQTEQHITDAGPVTIQNTAGIVRVDQTVGAPITLTLPLASDKTCPVLISDWKGDAGTNNITIETSGSDTFPGGLTEWTIAADIGSVFLRPISGVGYVL